MNKFLQKFRGNNYQKCDGVNGKGKMGNKIGGKKGKNKKEKIVDEIDCIEIERLLHGQNLENTDVDIKYLPKGKYLLFLF